MSGRNGGTCPATPEPGFPGPPTAPAAGHALRLAGVPALLPDDASERRDLYPAGPALISAPISRERSAASAAPIRWKISSACPSLSAASTGGMASDGLGPRAVMAQQGGDAGGEGDNAGVLAGSGDLIQAGEQAGAFGPVPRQGLHGAGQDTNSGRYRAGRGGREGLAGQKGVGGGGGGVLVVIQQPGGGQLPVTIRVKPIGEGAGVGADQVVQPVPAVGQLGKQVVVVQRLQAPAGGGQADAIQGSGGVARTVPGSPGRRAAAGAPARCRRRRRGPAAAACQPASPATAPSAPPPRAGSARPEPPPSAAGWPARRPGRPAAVRGCARAAAGRAGRRGSSRPAGARRAPRRSSCRPRPCRRSRGCRPRRH
jgi:hypothetical protein